MVSTTNRMDALLAKQTIYGSVAFNKDTAGKMYTHHITLSDGSPMQIVSRVSVLCSFSIDKFRQEGEAEVARRKVKQRYLAKKAKQNST